MLADVGLYAAGLQQYFVKCRVLMQEYAPLLVQILLRSLVLFIQLKMIVQESEKKESMS
jgi:hypothetical protein